MEDNPKVLVKKFSFRELQTVMKEKGWRLMYLREVKFYLGKIDHKEFWIADLPLKEEDIDSQAMLYDVESGKACMVNKNNIYPAVVWKTNSL